MRRISPQRRLAVLFAATASLFASTPLLLLSGLPVQARHFFTGLCLGISLSLLIAATIQLRRCHHRSPLA